MTRDIRSGHILCVVGARPNFMKIAPIIRAFKMAQPPIPVRLLHTGQHYDAAMKQSFFDQLSIPEPDIDLGVGSGSHAVQTAEIMRRVEPELDANPPAAVLVVGDVNSTIACSLVAVKKGLPVVHVEAGLRSGDRTMPEEVNRVLTDQISDLLFTTERDALDNLCREGIDAARVHFVGNVMIDSLFYNLEQAVPVAQTVASMGLDLDPKQPFGLLTLHRPSNVDVPEVLRALLRVLIDISGDMPLLFPVHPRTAGCIEAAGMAGLLEQSNIKTCSPLGYHQMLGAMRESRVVFTDSGGLQEETTALGVPCVTLRENTERPITLAEGTNTLVGTDPDKIYRAWQDIRQSGGKQGRVPELWDGRAAERIAAVMASWMRGDESS